jgi:serine/threonine-protein kinase
VSDVGVVQLSDSFPGKASTDNDYAPYAAPEVRKGAPTSVRSDIYSAGRLLYFLLLGAHPTDPDEDVPVLAALRAKAPEGLVRIVRRATALDPAMRYSGIEDLLGDIAKYQSAGLVGLPAPELPTGSAPSAAVVAAPKPSVPRDAGDVVRAPAAERNRVDAQRRLAAAQARAPQSRAVHTQVPAPSAEKPAAVPEAPDQDVASFRQRLVLVAFGAGVLAAGLAATFVSGVESIVGASAVIVGAVGLSALVPAAARLPRASRTLWALLVAAAVVWFDPGIHAARAGRAWLLGPSRPATRVAALRGLHAKGLVEFVDLDLGGADLSGLDLSFLVFDRTRLASAKLVGTRLAGASLVDVDLSGADLSGADLRGVDVTRTLGWDETICSAETRLPTGWTCRDGEPLPVGGLEVSREVEPEPRP